MNALLYHLDRGRFTSMLLFFTVFLGISIAQTRADILYVDEFYQGNIVKVDTSNGSVSPFVSGLSYPEGLAADKSGNIYVATQTAGVIDKISPSGVITPFVTSLGGYYLSGMAFDSSGDLYVGANRYAGTYVSAIFKFSSSGALLSTWSWGADGLGPLQPTGLAFDSSGNLWVTDYSGNALYSISPSGTPTEIARMAVNPLGLVFGPDGNLYVANRSSGTIDEITSSGFISTYASGLDNPSGLVFDQSGNLYTTDSPNGGDGTDITLVANGGGSIFASGLDEPLYVIDVPEPAPFALLCLGVPLMWKFLRKPSKV